MTVRRARPADLPSLPAIEDAAEDLLLQAGARLGNIPPTDPDLYTACDEDRLFVATPADSDDLPVGFLRLEAVDALPHIAEMDVLPAHTRQGHGAALVQAALHHAQACGAPAVTLTTFRDIPFNAPFYARHGFVLLEDDSLTPGLRAILAAEAAAGFDPAARCAMRCPLPQPDPDRLRELLLAGHTDQVRELLRASPVFGLDLAVLGADALPRLDLSGTALRGLRLGTWTTTGAHAALEDCDLTDARMGLAALWGARLRGARLRRADLRGANLSGADLRATDLRDACLRGAILRRARLQGADLRDADLRGADLRDAVLEDTQLQGAQTFGVRLSPGVQLP